MLFKLFIYKDFDNMLRYLRRKSVSPATLERAVPVREEQQIKEETNKTKKVKDMPVDYKEIEKLANELAPEQKAKRVKKDKGLIERVESSKILITEDNRQLLMD